VFLIFPAVLTALVQNMTPLYNLAFMSCSLYHSCNSSVTTTARSEIFSTARAEQRPEQTDQSANVGLLTKNSRAALLAQALCEHRCPVGLWMEQIHYEGRHFVTCSKAQRLFKQWRGFDLEYRS